MKTPTNPLLVFFFLVFNLLNFALSHQLISCLSSGGVKNFTTDYTSNNGGRLFQQSVQNLRFAKLPNKPVAVIFPENAEQVATAIRCARRSSGPWTIRLRSGGHSFEGLSSHADAPFVLVDMMNMNRIAIDLESHTAWVEAGTTVGQLYHAIATSSKSTYGFPAGMILSAGVPGEMAKLWHKWQLVASDFEDDFFLQALVLAARDQPKTSSSSIWMLFMGLYLGPKTSALASLTSAFPELNATLTDCEEMSWAEAMISLRGDPQVKTLEDLTNRFSFRKTFSKAKSDFVEVPISVQALEGALELLAAQHKAAILLDPFGGAMRTLESDASPFPFRAGTLYGIEYFIDWDEEEDVNSEQYIAWMRGFYDYMGDLVMKTPRGAYVNNVDLDLGVRTNRTRNQESGGSDYLAQVTADWGEKFRVAADAVEEARSWGEKYFMGNYDRLVRAKTLIDPTDVFRHPQSIPPLASSI
ncbi:hypothetical protein H6P81_009079 [Aristolochia fimbriata]|uniref:FAD-binding PCMH-type domain-containing protein n=1 Tax=Aristolochia fimbriata TaxID=158543 RepID=A0AAV7EK75_ARIFI|nr:hypothetical protein H6P81_009079 [Aristolochia fimbriata]